VAELEEKIFKPMDTFGVNSGWVLAVVGIPVLVFTLYILNISFARVLGFAIALAPLWLPVVSFFFFFEFWMYYVGKYFDIQQGRVSLEILLPQEIFKSPVAMEAVLTQLWQTASPDNHIQTYWDGKHPPYTALEIISTGGNVRFIVNTTRKKNKNIAEWHLYAQYPGIEVRELPIDYTAQVRWDPKKFSVFSLHFGLRQPNIYPIKTFYDYGLDKDPKEEFKIDPITTIIELLGSIGPNEHIWYQFLIKPHRAKEFKTGSLKYEDDWKPKFEKEIKEIMKKAKERGGGSSEEEGGGMTPLTDDDRDKIKALERSRGKYAFNTFVRVIYAAEKDAYVPGERIGAIITAFFNFNDFNRNAFQLRWRTDFDWNWWQDPTGRKKDEWKKSELMHYKKRIYQPRTTKDVGSILTTEELATIFHLPGKVAATPSLGRIPSTRGEAPPNLPIAS
jgi:hypothetical protein